MPQGVVFLLVFSVLVLVHELGHFLAARLLRIRVEEFAFGLPFTKPILKIKRGVTQYAVYPLLFGGFVRLHGEEGPSTVKDARGKDFWSRGKKQRMVVIGAGVVMNMLLALAAFVVLYSVVGLPKQEAMKVTVLRVEENSPAAAAGIKTDDRIVEVEGRAVTDPEEFTQLVKAWSGLGVNLTLERGQGQVLFEGIVEQDTEKRVVNVVPRVDPPEGQGAVGVVISAYPYLKTEKCSILPTSHKASLGAGSVWCFTGAVSQGIKSTKLWTGRVVDGLRQIGQSLLAGKAPEGVAGPVGIYQLTGEVAAQGWLPLLELVAILSVNLGVFNILPIPALDGGRMAFIWWEWVSKKRVSAELEKKVNSWGLAFLLTLMVLISFQDLIRLGLLQELLGN